MEDKKYIVIVRGVLKFSTKEKVPSGGFVPSGIPKEEIEDKLKRKQIAVFDSDLSAMVQASNSDKIDATIELKEKIKNLETEKRTLKKEIKDLNKEIASLEKENVDLKEILEKESK